jgi:hypothetical protein
MKKYIKFFLILLILSFLILIIAGCEAFKEGFMEGFCPECGYVSLEIVGGIKSIKIEKSNGSYYITGLVKNKSYKTYSYVKITFNLYDEDGNLIGNATDTISNLKPNETWKFKALILVDDISKIKKIKLAKLSALKE